MQYARSGKLEVPSALAVDGPVTGLPKVILGQILASAYRDYGDLRQSIEDFIDRYYDCRRLQSALGYRSPEDFKHKKGKPTFNVACTAAIMTFLSR